LEEQLARGDASTKSRLLNVAAAVGGTETLRLIQREARSQDPEVALTALRVLAEWPDVGAFDGLSSIAASTKDTRSRTLAMRGLVRLAPQVKQDPGAAAQSLSRMLPQANVSEKKQLLSALGQLSDGAGLEILRNFLDDPDAGAEARLAAVKALEAFRPGPNDQAKRILNTLKQADPELTVKERLQVLDWKFSDLPNLSPSATATSTTGLGPDGQGGPASAAIDGNLQTYWDETDNQKLYALKIELKKPAQLGFLRICGWKHHEYAPKDFEILCDGKPAAKVESAQYVNNWLTVVLNGTECQVIELRIHGYYAASPAIRELEIRGKIVQTNTNR
jgi:HEAT repeat protein